MVGRTLSKKLDHPPLVVMPSSMAAGMVVADPEKLVPAVGCAGLVELARFWSWVTASVTRTLAVASALMPAIVPWTVKVPGPAYCEGEMLGQVTGTARSTPSVESTRAVGGSTGANPLGVTVE